MNAATISGSTFQLRDPTNALVAATVTYDGTTFTATLQPTSQLTASTAYKATVTGGATGVKDQSGNALAANFAWSFTTGGVGSSPPTVTSVSPPNGATIVSVGTKVTATFSLHDALPIFSGSTFQLRDPTNALVAATVTYDGTTFTATLQ